MESKRVLTLLLGSPRVGGNSEELADALAGGAKRSGYEIRKVRLAAMTLKGCKDCRGCWNTGRPCVQNDDMDKVYADIEEASVLAFVSPVYFYSWTAQIKPVWDRLIPYGSDKAARTVGGKKAILLATAGDTAEECFDGLTASFRQSSAWAGWDIDGEICAPGIYTKGEMRSLGAKYMELAERLGEKL